MKSKKNIYSALALIVFTLLFLASAQQKKTLKTFVDPSLQTSSIKSIAVFSLRNTSLSPGEALELDRAMTQAFLQKNSAVKIIGASEATSKLNEASLVEEYSKFLYDFEHSGIPNTTTLKKIGTQLGVDAILQGTLYDVIQRDGSYPGVASLTSLTLRYTLMSTNNGNTLWEGTSNARKSGATTFSKAAPLYEVIDLAQKKILTGLPELGK
jgi:hypothetical protein